MDSASKAKNIYVLSKERSKLVYLKERMRRTKRYALRTSRNADGGFMFFYFYKIVRNPAQRCFDLRIQAPATRRIYCKCNMNTKLSRITIYIMLAPTAPTPIPRSSVCSTYFRHKSINLFKRILKVHGRHFRHLRQ